MVDVRSHTRINFTVRNLNSPRKVNEMMWCSLGRRHVVLFWMLMPCMSVFNLCAYRYLLFLCVKTNYISHARNKHITNYQFFSGKCHIVTHVAHCRHKSLASTVMIVKNFSLAYAEHTHTHIRKLTEAIVKLKKIIIIIHFRKLRFTFVRLMANAIATVVCSHMTINAFAYNWI